MDVVVWERFFVSGDTDIHLNVPVPTRAKDIEQRSLFRSIDARPSENLKLRWTLFPGQESG